MTSISCFTSGPKPVQILRVVAGSFGAYQPNLWSNKRFRSSFNQHSYGFYNQSALSSSIETASATASHRVKPSVLLQNGKTKDVSLRTARFLHKELPVRLAHRIESFMRLPYCVGSNSNIQEVKTIEIIVGKGEIPQYETDMYKESFQELIEFPKIVNVADDEKYAELVSTLFKKHMDVINKLAEGFSQCAKHINNDDIRIFLDRTLVSRLGIRMLCTHYLHLHEEKPDHVGIVNAKFSPSKLIKSKAQFVRAFCEDKYGHSPRVVIQGHEQAEFPYISPPLDYILVELLKNAFRSTLEFHEGSMDNLPPVEVTITNNNIDFIIRISDRGGGIDHAIVNKIWDYNFTTSGLTENSNTNRGLFGEIVKSSNSLGKMHGYGFGLPTSRAYADYLGGSLTMETMQGFGSDVYLRLRHIIGKHETFRI